MNDEVGPTENPGHGEGVQPSLESISQRICSEHGAIETPAADATGQAGGPGPAPGVDAGQAAAIVDPFLARKICESALRLMDRVGCRIIGNAAFKSSGGDKAYAETIARECAWTEESLKETAELAYLMFKEHSQDKHLTPTKAFFASYGMHLAGQAVAYLGCRERKKETEQLTQANGKN